jgi:hypothetical protein
LAKSVTVEEKCAPREGRSMLRLYRGGFVLCECVPEIKE